MVSRYFSMEELLTQESWKNLLQDEFKKPYMKELELFLNSNIRDGKSILPPKVHWFEALNITPLDSIKVVILGQDPYPTKGYAHGLCFSVKDGVSPLPKSLKNIYKELYSDLSIDNSHTGYLYSWAKEGVLLINAVLTVEEGKSNSHKDKGWEIFTDKIISIVDTHCEDVVFLLWGAYAQKKAKHIDEDRHFIIKDRHPSPLSAYRGFFGSKPFSKINNYLISKDKEPIEWKIEDNSRLF